MYIYVVEIGEEGTADYYRFEFETYVSAFDFAKNIVFNGYIVFIHRELKD